MSAYLLSELKTARLSKNHTPQTHPYFAPQWAGMGLIFRVDTMHPVETIQRLKGRKFGLIVSTHSLSQFKKTPN